MSTRRYGCAVLLSLPLAALAVGVVFLAKSDEVRAQPLPGECELATPPQGPEEPLELNSVVSRDFVKTIAVEKEVFNCIDQFGRPLIKDVETFIEVVERRQGQEITLVDERVEVAECVKNLANGRVTCSARTLTLAPGATPSPLVACDPPEDIPQPRDPVEMDTVAVGNLVKTTKVEKETFACGQGPALKDFIGDLYIFTGIVEGPGETAEGESTLQPIATGFLGMMCFKDEIAGTVEACRRTVR
jgi:hypothetical protein